MRVHRTLAHSGLGFLLPTRQGNRGDSSASIVLYQGTAGFHSAQSRQDFAVPTIKGAPAAELPCAAPGSVAGKGPAGNTHRSLCSPISVTGLVSLTTRHKVTLPYCPCLNLPTTMPVYLPAAFPLCSDAAPGTKSHFIHWSLAQGGCPLTKCALLPP